jgi:GNAT superfamily N-acetyltransferase
MDCGREDDEVMTKISFDAAHEQAALPDGTHIDAWVLAEDQRVHVSAWDEHDDLIGAAWFDTTSGAHPHTANVEVTPAHRRQGVGRWLLRRLLAEASSLGIATLTWTTPADDLAARRLSASCGAPCARRLANGRAKVAIYVPVDRSTLARPA